MQVNRNLDIRKMDWPLCILECKKELNQMNKGEQIKITVKDINVVSNLVALIDQLSVYSIEKFYDDGNHKLIIKKIQ